MATATKPAILLVQGSFQLPEVYSKLTNALKAKGYSVTHPELPSLRGQDDPSFGSKTLLDDAATIQAAAENLVKVQKSPVVVLMHSYGGLVGTTGIPRELSRVSRKEQGKAGGVIRLIYVTAFVLDEGQSVLGVFGESPNNDIRPGGRFRIKDAGPKMYSDLPAEEAQYWSDKIIDQSYAVQTTELTRAAYKYIPSTYVVTENDETVPAQFQEMFAGAAGADILKIAAGHSPMLSKAEELTELIDATATKTLETVNN